MQTELIIAGGGIIGLYTAYFLVDSDVKITVIDRGQFGQESSWAAGGILMPLLPWQYSAAVTNLTHAAADHYADLSSELLAATGTDIEFWRCGLEILQSNLYPTADEWCRLHSVETQSADIPSVHPAIANLHVHQSGMYLPQVAQIRSPRLIKAMLTYLVQKGVDLLPDTELIECIVERDRISGVQTSRGHIRTRQLIWATGAWAQQLRCSRQPITPPHVAPIRGQILAFEGQKIGLDTIVFDNDHYLIPRKDGLILAGSTLENVGFDKSVTTAALQELRQKSLALLPQLNGCEIVRQWSGLRPASNDNVPTIGPHPRIEGLYFNCGHFRYGIAMAPQSAKIIADWILNTGNRVPDSTYKPTDTPARIT